MERISAQRTGQLEYRAGGATKGDFTNGASDW